MTKNAWLCEREETLLKTSVMEIIQRDCRSSEDQRAHRFYLLKSKDWCNIIPITEDGKVVLVKQYRIGISSHTLEVPGGIADAEGESLKDAAIRELAEETGYVALPHARCVELGWTHPNPAILDNRVHGFVIGPVRREREQKLDVGEMIETIEVPIPEIPQMILRGEISHALMLNTFFHLALRSRFGERSVVESLTEFVREAPADV